jgi:hypothetical protein
MRQKTKNDRNLLFLFQFSTSFIENMFPVYYKKNRQQETNKHFKGTLQQGGFSGVFAEIGSA